MWKKIICKPFSCGELKRRDHFTKTYQAGKHFTLPKLSSNSPRRRKRWYLFWLILQKELNFGDCRHFFFFFPLLQKTLRENRVANLQMSRDVFRLRRLEDVFLCGKPGWIWCTSRADCWCPSRAQAELVVLWQHLVGLFFIWAVHLQFFQQWSVS